MDFPKKQQQCLIPKYLLDYLGEVNELHPDPSDLGGGDNIEAGTGIEITGDETKTISVDETVVAMKTDIPDVSDFITEDEVDTKLEDYELKADAFSGSYNDLTDKPDLSVYELKSEAFSGDYDDLTNKPDLSIYETKAEAFSGDYEDLTNKPTIPTKTSELTNDSGYITGVTWNDVTGKPTFATVATTGDYDDLTDKPDLSVYALSSSLANVATTGDYDDLTNKPTIPTVGDGTIRIIQDGSTKGTFTLNQSTNLDITVEGPNTGNYYTKTEVDNLVEDAVESVDKPDQVVGGQIRVTTGCNDIILDPVNNSGYQSLLEGTNFNLVSTNGLYRYTINMYVPYNNYAFRKVNTIKNPFGTKVIDNVTYYNIRLSLFAREKFDLGKYSSTEIYELFGNEYYGTFLFDHLLDTTGEGDNTNVVAHQWLDGSQHVVVRAWIGSDGDVHLLETDDKSIISYKAYQETTLDKSDISFEITNRYTIINQTTDIRLNVGFYWSTAQTFPTNVTPDYILWWYYQNGTVQLVKCAEFNSGATSSYNCRYYNYPLNGVSVVSYTDGSTAQDELDRIVITGAAFNNTEFISGDVYSYDRKHLETLVKQPTSLTYQTLKNISTVNNSTITITQGGVSKGTFTLNQSSDSTIALDAGGGSSYSAGTGIDITSDVISVDTTTVAMKTDIPSLTNYVTTNTDQNITGVKTFVGGKRIAFKMSASNDKLGFTCYDNNNKEIGYLESRIKSSVPQMSIGMYNTTSSNYDRKLQLSYQSNNGGTTYNYNIVCPTRLQKNGSDVFMPVSVNGTEADNTGNITLSIPTVVDTVADGNMNAVTSNAVYDIVGDIETLLAAL